MTDDERLRSYSVPRPSNAKPQLTRAGYVIRLAVVLILFSLVIATVIVFAAQLV